MNFFKNSKPTESIILKNSEPIESIILKNSDKDITYLTTVSRLQELDIKNWIKNRCPDESRIIDIIEDFTKRNLVCMPGIICIWNDTLNDKYYIYDGAHRYYASIDRFRNFGIDMKCIVRLVKTIDENEIVVDFQNINKSISVPFLYLEDTYEEGFNNKKEVCENVVNYLCVKYKPFTSPSRKCRQSNFNRDNLIELIRSLEINWKQHGLKSIIINKIETLVRYSKEYVINNNIKYPKKCADHNFFLFYLGNDFIKKQIETSLV